MLDLFPKQISPDESSINTKLGRETAVTDDDTNYTSYMARGQSLNSSETTPTKNGQIAWQYECGENMAHKTLISGTSYALKGGTDLTAGTSYQTWGGRTLVNGTRYEVCFEPEIGLTWYFNSVIDAEYSATYVANFVSDGVTFKAMRTIGGKLEYQYQGGSMLKVYTAGRWLHAENRTVTFEEPPSGALLEWLQANAMQQ